MTIDTDPRTAPAAGLFGGGKRAEAEGAPARAEPSAVQRKAFAQLFKADGGKLHAA